MQKEIGGRELDKLFIGEIEFFPKEAPTEIQKLLEQVESARINLNAGHGWIVDGEYDEEGKPETLDLKTWKKIIHIADEEDREMLLEMLDTAAQREYDGVDEKTDEDLMGTACVQEIEAEPINPIIAKEEFYEAISAFNKSKDKNEKNLLEKKIAILKKDLAPRMNLLGIFNRKITKRPQEHVWDFVVTFKKDIVAKFVIRAKEKNNGIAWWVNKQTMKREVHAEIPELAKKYNACKDVKEQKKIWEQIKIMKTKAPQKFDFSRFEGKIQRLTVNHLPFSLIVTINNGQVELGGKDGKNFNFFDNMMTAGELDALNLNTEKEVI